MEKTYIKVLKELMRADRYISGENISEKLNISRSAVWKAIEKLRQEGCEIIASTNRGYMLKNKEKIVTESLIKEFAHIDNDFCILQTINSTNLYANRLAIDGAKNGTVVVSMEQTQGSGRLGRSFSSPKYEGIYYSYILEPHCSAEKLSMLTSLAGLCVCETLAEVTNEAFSIKWPNDIIYDGKKVSGILTRLVTNAETMEISHAIIGIGINVLQSSFQNDLADKAISLLQITGKSFSLSQIIAILTQKLNTMFIEHNSLIESSEENLTRLRELSCTVGKEVNVISPLDERRGMAIGIADNGGLIVDFGSHIETVLCGEVSVRGVLGYSQ